MKKYFDLSPTEWQDLQNLTFEEINVDWKQLIIKSERIKTSDYEYLNTIYKYSNNQPKEEGIGSGGILAYKFTYGEDLQFEKLLDFFSLPLSYAWLGDRYKIDFISTLFSKSGIYTSLSVFLEDDLHEKIKYSSTIGTRLYQSSLMIPSFLAELIYNYGMYDYCYHHLTKNEIMKITSDFTDAIFENDFDKMVGFSFLGGWNKWFDIHSCTDNTFLLINRNKKTIWLLCVSHSD